MNQQTPDAVVVRALAEDLGVAPEAFGPAAAAADATTLATVPADAVGIAHVVARGAGVLAGIGLVAQVFHLLDPQVEVDAVMRDGDPLAVGDRAASVRGPLRAILTGERTALNLVCHLSGVATATRAYVDAIAGTGCVVRDTRKTTPGMRRLEKAAVVAGGGVNHRTGLYDGLLVKDNHVVAAGGIGAAARAALAAAGGLPVQVEVDDLDQLDQALDAGARDVLLDNFAVVDTATAVARVRSRENETGAVWLESSGGIDLTNVRGYALAGVDSVAIGAVTHSAPQVDLGLDVEVRT
jgi:nicotinate-nucleotide pyrophosphorylase (carboxylating)